MSASYHFHQIKNPEPLEVDFLNEQLKSEFTIVGEIGLLDNKKVGSFYVKSKIIKLEGDHEKEGICFVWDDEHKYYSVSELHFGLNSNYDAFYQVVSLVAKRLNFVIDDPQYGLNNISPNIFASPKKIHQEFERKKFKENVKDRFRSFFRSKLKMLLTNYHHSIINDLTTSFLFIIIFYITFAFKITVFVFLLLFMFLAFIYLGRRRVLTMIVYLLIMRYYWYVFTNRNSILENDLISNSISGIVLLLIYGFVHTIYYGLRYKGAQKQLAIEIKSLEETHFIEKDLKNFCSDDYYTYLYTKLFTKEGLSNFTIFVLLILGSVFVKRIM